MTQKFGSGTRQQRGSVFVVTLAVMAGLVVLMTALSVAHRESVRALTNRTDDVRARLMAEAGIQRAIAEVQQVDPTHCMLNDSWSQLGGGGSTQIVCGGDSFRVQVFDACSRVNINTAGQEQLTRLPLSADQVACLLDWRDSTKAARAGGAKDDYYNTLAHPYNAKLQPFDSVQELLLVRGFPPQALYTPAGSGGAVALADILTADSQSEDLNRIGQPKIDIRSATPDQLVAFGVPSTLANSIVQSAGSFSRLGDIFNVQGMNLQAARALADNVTIGAPASRPGLINLNTASESVIASMPTLNSDMASSIIERQSTGFRSIGDLLDVPGMNLSILGQIADRVCVSSRSFVVHVMGTAGFANVAMETTLTVDDKGQVRIGRLEPEPAWEVFNRWGWPQKPTSQQVIGGGS